MEKIKKAYDEILNAIKKHKDICVFDFDELDRKANLHLFGIELKEKFGLDINPKDIYSLDWTKFGEYRVIGRWGEKYNRTISWSDDGSQPKDEILLQISFPTGAYIFGEDYPVELFQAFFLELKSFNPKFCDSQNKCLYFPLDQAKDVFNQFSAILKKYHEIHREDSNKRRIAKIKAELEILEKQQA